MTETPDQNEAPHASAERGDDAERIAKVLARAGLCSRREAEEWVLAGRIAVNGRVLASPAFTVTPKDRVTVDGVALPTKERTRLWLFHKPRGLVTTNQDPEGRPTVFSVLPEDMPRVVTVGRLDINTEGLLLLTNDGGVARVLELPSTGWLRRYRVRAFGSIDEAALKDLEQGVSLDGVDYGPIEARIERVQGSNVWLVLGLREGKNREVKRVLASLGLTVNRLIRVSFGPFQLADLEEGEIREIRGRILRDQLGPRLVAESGADFEAPIVHQLQGDGDEDEGRKRRIRGFTPAEEGPRERGRGPARTHMEFVGTGEKRSRDRDRDGRRDGERGGDRDGERGDRGFRSQGFRDRPAGGGGGGGRPQKWRSEGFRDRPEGGRGRGDDRRSEGFCDRPDGGPQGKGFRGRRDRDFGGPSGERSSGEVRPPRDRLISEGRRGRPEGGRPEGGRPRSEGFRDRPRGEGAGKPGKGRSEGFRDRPRGEGAGKPGKGRSEGFRDRPRGEGAGAPGKGRSEGFRDGPRGEGAGAPGKGRPEGFRDRPRGDFAGKPGKPRSEGFRGRPDGERPAKGRSEGFRDRSEGRPEGEKRPPRAEGFGPRGPRGMSPGGRKGGPDGAPKGTGPGRGGKGPNRGGGNGRGGRG